MIDRRGELAVRPALVSGMSTKAEERLMNPAPGSAIEAAREFGIDLTLIIERLRLTPEERVRELQRAMNALAQIQGVARKSGEPIDD
jgi:hypothetical protein